MSFFNRYQIVLMIIFVIFIVKKFKLLELFSQRSKCFSCEKESDKPHPSSCYACEDQKNNILLNVFPQRWG